MARTPDGKYLLNISLVVATGLTYHEAIKVLDKVRSMPLYDGYDFHMSSRAGRDAADWSVEGTPVTIRAAFNANPDSFLVDLGDVA